MDAITVFGDVHGNLSALDAVLSEMARLGHEYARMLRDGAG